MQNGSTLSTTMESGYLHSEEFDDDGRIKRTGSWTNATAHIITAVIGSGVLSLAWCFAQLGWLAGSITIVLFSVITLYTSLLLTECYRDPVTGARNYTYMDAVKSNLGKSRSLYSVHTSFSTLLNVMPVSTTRTRTT
ncbi:putative amino acid transporter, transmembrane domain-containing protein [Helianthus annuus]|uniref:Amino acid transporter, transmembrane domain-containing protein n=1 Tax=Helianthus annuus TaxID=4232 RepID=A0A9K3I4U8_HELAN|nr:putative amino acid transporter, transmembrane domain-containing protein [Helianthus annuus]KAJ0525294.1 putative amino acid transporter, transmembrane domain-containing protein [Helianthus annuus]KAJ0533355.1 putative amino acid transporter, transmembrane domain-containing protein [Helianthus annuus]KAJ0541669.1 putative amino acid transporter, transmembrane domain-containing protein [Helianthus annuus]KAJ0706744.1 putative amino acid transporter, transmembrane domain-containing protein [He